MPSYKIGFFQLSTTPTAQAPNAYAAVRGLIASPAALAMSVSGYTREVYGLKEDRDRGVIFGRFRKIRTTDLPAIGEVGREAEELDLENKGLIDQNFFALFEQHSLLLWQVNNHANGTSQFRGFLEKHLGVSVTTDPLLQRGAIERLLASESEFSKIELTLPRPTNPDLFFEEDFSKEALAMLSASNGDSIKIIITTDGRLKQKRGIVNRLKRSLAELSEDGDARVARVVATEDGIEHPIDLIADRIRTTVEVDHDGKYPPVNDMYNAICGAKDEQKAAIEAYFGVADRVLG